MEMLDGKVIQSVMQSQLLARLSEIEILSTIDSTNRYTLEKKLPVSSSASVSSFPVASMTSPEQPQTAYVCIAEEQTAGRGRQGNHWISPKASNLYLSLLWRFPSSFSISNLSLASGVAMANALRRYGLEAVKLKWPNDVIYAGRKLAGILVETTNESNGMIRAVIGIGLNIAMPANVETIDQPWIDIQTITGAVNATHQLRNQLAAWLIEELLLMLPVFEAQGFSAFRSAWEMLDGLHGCEVTINTPHGSVHGKAVGIDVNGSLLVECGDITHRFHYGDVHVRRTV